jgi:hypothetical protein
VDCIQLGQDMGVLLSPINHLKSRVYFLHHYALNLKITYSAKKCSAEYCMISDKSAIISLNGTD